MKLPLFVFLLLCFSSCQKGKTIKWDHVIFEKRISDQPVYQKMNTQKEILAIYEHDTTLRRTSDVTYIIDYGSKKPVTSSKFFNCRAYYLNPEILTINIGLGSGLSGEGFIINYKDGKFYTEPYFYTDLDSETRKESVYKVVRQTLTLDKSKYNAGDSLYGKINFHILEINKDSIQAEHRGDGYFRTKIAK